MADNYCKVCGAALQPDGKCNSCDSRVITQEMAAPQATDPFAPVSAPKGVDDLIGKIVADRYRVREVLGKGGVGRVYRAEQIDLERPVALKLLDDAPDMTDEQRERFRREARAAGAMVHSGLAAVYDFGQWEERPYIAMELVEGQTLYQVFAAEYPLEHLRVVNLMTQICDALAMCHRRHIVHRDMKPENVMLFPLPEGGAAEGIKILDFGLALLVGPRAEIRLTREGMVSGTPYYMSPEQCRGDAVTPATDVYSLGVMLYEQLCGRLPFLGESPTKVLLMHLYTDPDPPSEVNPKADVPQALEEICLGCLSKDPGARPAHAGELADLLRAAKERGLNHAPERSRAMTVNRSTAEMADRQARAEAFGIPNLPAQGGAPPDPEHSSVLVVERPDSFGDSLTALLRRQAFNAAGPDSLAGAEARLERFHPDVVVVDLAPEPELALDELQAKQRGGALQGVPLVVVGPSDQVGFMARALELGIADYLPRERVLELLPRSLRRISRRRRGRAAQEPR